MKKTRETNGDVRWLDEVALHRAVMAKDREAFAELIRRFDPVVRAQLARLTPRDGLDVAIADFWCGLIARDLQPLRGWHPDTAGLLAQWIRVLAAQATIPACRSGRATASSSRASSRPASRSTAF